MVSRISRRKFLKLSALSTAGIALGLPFVEDHKDIIAAAPLSLSKSPPGFEPNSTDSISQVWPRQGVTRSATLALMNGVHSVGINNPYANGYSHQYGGASQQEGLFYYAALTGKIYPWLAGSYAYNGDATEITVYLRHGVRWSDGEDFTADDVAFTYTMLKQFAPDLRDSSSVDNAVDSVEVMDDYTVKFTLTEPNYRFHFTHCTYHFDCGVYLLPEHIYSQFSTALEIQEFQAWDPDHGDYGVFTGPYLLVRSEADFCEFHRRYEWWAKDIGLADHMPQPEAITDILYPSDELGAQLIINDEVDCTLDMRPPVIASILAQAGDHIVTYTGQEKPYGYVDWWPISVFPNNNEFPYDDVRVRWALAYAIDQQGVVDVGQQGTGLATFRPTPNYPALSRYYDSPAMQATLATYNVLEHNTTKVDSLMTAASFVQNADGFWTKGGVTFDCDLWADSVLFGDIAPVIAEYLRQAGFPCNHVSPPDVWTGKSDGRAMLHLFGHGGSVVDPWATLQMYHSQWWAPTGENCGQNRPRWKNAAYDAIVDEMGSTSPDDTVKTQQLFDDAMAIWYQELPEVPLVEWFHRIAMNTTYWGNWPWEYNTYNTAFWHLTFPITLWRLHAQQAGAVLQSNYETGAPGSWLTVFGSGFPANALATVTVNGNVISTSVATGTDGEFMFLLDTQQADEGFYVVEASVNPSASVSFRLMNAAPVRVQEDVGSILTVPAGIALKSVFLPLVIGGQ